MFRYFYEFSGKVWRKFTFFEFKSPLFWKIITSTTFLSKRLFFFFWKLCFVHIDFEHYVSNLNYPQLMKVDEKKKLHTILWYTDNAMFKPYTLTITHWTESECCDRALTEITKNTTRLLSFWEWVHRNIVHGYSPSILTYKLKTTNYRVSICVLSFDLI